MAANFRCECGIEKDIIIKNVVSSHTLSCGCWSLERPREGRVLHRLTGTGAHRSYHAMLTRCRNPRQPGYKNYGGRGIKVCDRWQDSFLAFYEDMGDRPPRMTLDRIDVDGDYSPENCRWATAEQQKANRTDSRFITWRGEKKTLSEWVKITGISKGCIEVRLDLGWSIERALTLPPIKGRNQYG